MKAAPEVRMYSRRRCGLCDEAREVLNSERERIPFAFDEVFIDEDVELESAYGLRVPVVLVDGVEEFEYQVEPARLRALLLGHPGHPGRGPQAPR